MNSGGEEDFVLSLSPTLIEEALREVVVDTLMECLKDGNAGKFHSSAYHKFIHTLLKRLRLHLSPNYHETEEQACLVCVWKLLYNLFAVSFLETYTGFDHKKAKWDTEVVSSLGYAKSSKHIGNENYQSSLLPNTNHPHVAGDGIYIPATDDEVMKVEDSIDHKSSPHYVLDNSQTVVCNSNDDTFGQEFMPIDCEDFSRVFKVPKVYSLYSSQFAAYADVVLLEPPVMEGLDLLLMETMVFGFA
ncbi:hypothetical protein L1987_27003 [Smallanthus sonchifolius]|uniref:Uncharacterized protein n=1 Tax=Smallanthus sonchifolius TaxID=185202 RepID=A0ACB9IBI0_9ASTR|nr:hypothetical protein L1987_27003 [Smallanthus sonchifolius]